MLPREAWQLSNATFNIMFGAWDEIWNPGWQTICEQQWPVGMGRRFQNLFFMTVCFDRVFRNTRSCERHTSDYNVFCKVATNLNPFNNLNTQSQFISTRTPTGPDIWKCHTTLVWTMAGLRAALPNISCCIIRNPTDWTILEYNSKVEPSYTTQSFLRAWAASLFLLDDADTSGLRLQISALSVQDRKVD